MSERSEEILEFWFGQRGDDDAPSGSDLWFARDAGVDADLKSRFESLVRQARAGVHDGWATTARGRLALILLLDQLPRFIYRDTQAAFESDEAALQLCYDGLDDELDKQLDIPMRAFFYQPAMHAEDVDAQNASIEVYEELADMAPPAYHDLCERFLRMAHRHREVVERFERFPHRNNIFDRSSSHEESAFLQTSGDEMM